MEPLTSDFDDVHTYVFDGPVTRVQGPEYLAEQLRQDGAASSLGAALSMSEGAYLYKGWLYLDDNNGEEFVLDHNDPSLGEAVETIVAKVPYDD